MTYSEKYCEGMIEKAYKNIVWNRMKLFIKKQLMLAMYLLYNELVS